MGNRVIALSIGGLMALGMSGMVSAASVPVAAKVSQPAPTLTQSTSYGSASSGWNTASSAPTAGSQTGLNFPTATLPSGSSATVASSDWVGVNVSVSNATSTTEWEVYGSASALTNSTDSSATIPASAYVLPGGSNGTSGPLWLGDGPDHSTSEDNGDGSYPNVTSSLSSTSTVIFDGLSADNIAKLDLQPQLVVPSGTTPGSYSGTITLSAQIQ